MSICYITDVLGIAKSCEEIQTLRARTTGRELRKRDVMLVDESNTMVKDWLLKENIYYICVCDI